MGMIGKLILGRNLVKLANVFEEVLVVEGIVALSVRTFEHDQPNSFAYLPVTLQTKIKFDLPKRLSALSKHPQHVITRELIKNGIVAKTMGRERRVVAYMNLYEYLLNRGIALDIDEFNASYET